MCSYHIEIVCQLALSNSKTTIKVRKITFPSQGRQILQAVVCQGDFFCNRWRDKTNNVWQADKRRKNPFLAMLLHAQ